MPTKGICDNTGRTHFKKGHAAWNKGKKLSKEYRQKLREAKLGKSGEQANNWRGGKIKDKPGYVFILKPEHPFCNNKRYVRRSHLVMEKKLGRYLTKEEVVHHRNEIKADDRPENLMLFPTDSAHQKFHKLLLTR